MSTITYLLGAGASANCLPVVCNMSTAIGELVKSLDLAVTNGDRSDDDVSCAANITSILRSLEEICDTNFSVDTFAKKLLVSGKHRDYEKLKDNLTLYFTLQQKFSRLDTRYDNFWAAILNNHGKLPKNIRVLSWNYDSQVELSFKEFTSAKSLKDAYSRLNPNSLRRKDQNYFGSDEFGFIKLNGSAKYKPDHFLNDDFGYLIEDFKWGNIDQDFFELLHSNLNELVSWDKVKKKRAYENELSFAWEHNFASEFYQKLSESVKQTTVLVAIGYSFPVYNREVDKKIINDFMPNLSKVYIQAPNASDLKERFSALTNSVHPDNIHIQMDTGQFIFPNELDTIY